MFKKSVATLAVGVTAAMSAFSGAAHAQSWPYDGVCPAQVSITTTECFNQDGKPSFIVNPGGPFCGASVQNALYNGNMALWAVTGYVLSDVPAPLSCLYTYVVDYDYTQPQ